MTKLTTITMATATALMFSANAAFALSPAPEERSSRTTNNVKQKPCSGKIKIANEHLALVSVDGNAAVAPMSLSGQGTANIGAIMSYEFENSASYGDCVEQIGRAADDDLNQNYSTDALEMYIQGFFGARKFDLN